MKKLAVLATVMLLLAGCTSQANPENNKKNEDTEVIQIYKDTFFTLLPEKERTDLYNAGLGMDDNEVAVLGQKLNDYTFTSTTGETIKLPENQAYVLEVVGSWCGYCQALTSLVFENKINDKIPVYQYFLYGTADDAESFYNAAGVTKPDNVIALTSNEDFEVWLEENEFYSVPLSILVDDSGKIALTHLGYVDAAPYNQFIDYGLTMKLYDVQTNGTSLSDFIKKQFAIRDYINSLDEIEVPKSYLD